MSTPSDMMPYVLLDSGRGRKLEQVGPYLVDRQAPQAFWRPRLPPGRWTAVHATHHRSESGGGHWQAHAELPASWPVRQDGLAFEVRLTPFGHLGIFAEHVSQWAWLREVTAHLGARRGRPPRVLNLFAYTGGATLLLAAAGAEVCHVDAARGIVDWARRNAGLNGLEERPIRWIVDDCRVFLERELRRGHRYDGVILDPPTYGRGARKEVWKIDEHLPDLLDRAARALSPGPAFLLLSCHSPGYTSLALEGLLADHFPAGDLQVTSGELAIEELSGRRLPSGTFVRASRES